MSNWTIKYQGQIRSRGKVGGSSLEGVAVIRSTSLDGALATFYEGFNQAVVRITSISEGQS